MLPEFLKRDLNQRRMTAQPPVGIKLTLDELNWPIVEVRLGVAVSHPEVAYLISRVDHWLALRSRFGILLDARGSLGLAPEQRNLLAANLLVHARAARRFLTVALVVDQPVRLHQVDVIPPNLLGHVPSLAFPDLDTARHWLERRLGVFRLEPVGVFVAASALSPRDRVWDGGVPGAYD